MPTDKSTEFSDFEKQAMRERAQELRSQAKAKDKKEAGLKEVLKAIDAMPEPDKTLAQKIHNIVMEVAPDAWPRTWYSMPAYAAEKDGKVVLFFQAASKFKARYATLGFNDSAKLDDGNMWETAFAIKKFTNTEEKKIVNLVKKAMG